MQIKGKKIVITAGGTIEEIDPVRYISNYSSGKMGIALADIAHKNGAETILITTVNVEDKDYKIVRVKSALDMQNAVKQEFGNADCVIMAAAVADYRPQKRETQKIKKNNSDELTIKLVKNPDILKEISTVKTSQIIVGFCAESENLIKNAKDKIAQKGCDYLVANDISRKDIGFSSDYNEVTILDKNRTMVKLERANKTQIAEQIFEVIF